MAKAILGFAAALCIGVGCRLFEIPLPGPPAILGAFLAVAMATGYTITDKILSARMGAAAVRPVPQPPAEPGRDGGQTAPPPSINTIDG